MLTIDVVQDECAIIAMSVILQVPIYQLGSYFSPWVPLTLHFGDVVQTRLEIVCALTIVCNCLPEIDRVL